MKKDPKLIALIFNECINNRDLEGLLALMTEDHSLICYDHVDTHNKEQCRRAWASCFNEYPDYRNYFSRLESREDFVAIAGYSTCSNEASLNGPALWSARIEDDKLSEWQVYKDTAQNRSRIGIE